MKKIIYCTIAVLVLAGTYAFRVIRHYNDILKDLQIAAEDANGYIFNNLEDGTLYIPSSSLITKMAVGKRAAAAQEMCEYIRKYTQTPEFEKAYQAARERSKPAENLTFDERLKMRIDTAKAGIKGFEQDLKKAGSQEERNIINDQIKQLKNELSSLTDPKDPMYKAMMDVIKMEDYGQSTKEDWDNWKRNYPPTSKELLRRRLNEFLQLTADIDFDAKLVERDGWLRFADQRLEEKDDNWKRCFRCGKETISTAMAFAQGWLKSM